MKKLNSNLLIVAIVCIVAGFSIIGLAIKSFIVISKTPQLPATREVVITLQQINFIQECIIVPSLGIGFIVVGFFIFSNLKARKQFE